MAGTSFPRVTIGIGNWYDSLYLRNGVVKVVWAGCHPEAVSTGGAFPPYGNMGRAPSRTICLPAIDPAITLMDGRSEREEENP